MNLLSSLWAMLRLRCPRCLKGKIFRGTFAMNDPCPDCGLVFQREEGYFLGAMYVSYSISSFFLLIFFLLGYQFLGFLDQRLLLSLIMLAFLPLVPLVFRYSRVIWMYIDRWVSPSDVTAGPYEKMREQQDREQQDRDQQGK